MSIEKVTPNFLKHASFPREFTSILNETIDAIPDDSSLGIYVYLARKPQDWQIQEKDIMKRFGRGRDHVRKCLGVLKKIGLLRKNAIRDERGHITHWETILYRHIPENPSSGDTTEPAPTQSFNHITENPSGGCIQITENPTSGKTHLLDNPTHTNKRYIQKKEKDFTNKTSSSYFNDFEVATLLRLRLESNPLPELDDDEFLEACQKHVEGRPKQFNRQQGMGGLRKILAMGTFEPAGDFKSKKQVEREKNQEAVKKREFEENQARQHAMKIKSYESGLKSKPSQEKSRPPQRLSDVLKGKIAHAN